MLKSDDFPTECLPNLTGQINSWLGDMIRSGHIKLKGQVAKSGKHQFEIGEQFVMVCLNLPEVQKSESLDRDLSELVRLTGRRHHQLKVERIPFAYARSLTSKNETLCQLFATKLADDVDRSIKWLDKYEQTHQEFLVDTWRVRLVTVPTFHTHAFLIQKIQGGGADPSAGSRIFVISAPRWLDQLQEDKFLTTREFLLGFKGKRPIEGVSATAEFPPIRNSKNKYSSKEERKAMAEANKAGVNNAESVSAPIGGDPGSHSTIGAGPNGLVPIFESHVYPYIKPSSGIGGEGGHAGTIGGPPLDQDPVFVIYTYPFLPKRDTRPGQGAPNIGHTVKPGNDVS